MTKNLDIYITNYINSIWINFNNITELFVNDLFHKTIFILFVFLRNIIFISQQQYHEWKKYEIIEKFGIFDINRL